MSASSASRSFCFWRVFLWPSAAFVRVNWTSPDAVSNPHFTSMAHCDYTGVKEHNVTFWIKIAACWISSSGCQILITWVTKLKHHSTERKCQGVTRVIQIHPLNTAGISTVGVHQTIVKMQSQDVNIFQSKQNGGLTLPTLDQWHQRR